MDSRSSQVWLLHYLFIVLTVLAPIVGGLGLFRMLDSGTGRILMLPATASLLFPALYFVRTKVSEATLMAAIVGFLCITIMSMTAFKGLLSNMMLVAPILMLASTVFYGNRGFVFVLIFLALCTLVAMVMGLDAGQVVISLESSQAIVLRSLTQLLMIVVTCLALRGIYLRQSKQDSQIVDQATTISGQRETIALLEDAVGCLLLTIKFDGTIAHQNKYAENLLGDMSESASIYDYAEDEDSRAGFAEALALATGGRDIASFPAILTTENGGQINVIVASASRKSSIGEPLDMVCAAADVTELQKERNRLRNLNKLEAVGLACARISHDFRNLLAVIRGNLELVNKEHLDQNSQLILDDVAAAVKDSIRLTQQIGEFSSSLSINPVPTKLRGLIEKCVSNGVAICPDRIRLTSTLDVDDVIVDMDGQVVTSIVLNLVKNSVEAIADQGEVTIYSRLDKSEPQNHPVLIVEVSDDGEGISEDNLSKVTEPFFSTKTKDKGLGLGLSTVRGMIEEAGGSLSIDSEPGRGTKISIAISAPLSPVHAANAT